MVRRPRVSGGNGPALEIFCRVYSRGVTYNLIVRFEMATINLRDVPDDLHRRAKARAAMEGVSLKQLIIRLLEEYLDGVC